MKTTLRLAVLALLLTVSEAIGQTIFPQPGSNIYLDGSHILVGSIPATVLGTNAPGSAGNALLSDGTNIYWGAPPAIAPGGTVTSYTVSNLTIQAVRITTNAFPLAPGTTWDWSRYWQTISTNADFNVTAIKGLTNNLVNMAELLITNNGASQIICHLQFALNKIGPNTTNDIYIASHKQAYVNGEAPGIGAVTNIVTLVEP